MEIKILYAQWPNHKKILYQNRTIKPELNRNHAFPNRNNQLPNRDLNNYKDKKIEHYIKINRQRQQIQYTKQ